MRYEQIFDSIPHEVVEAPKAFPTLELHSIPIQIINGWFNEITAQMYPIKRVQVKVKRRITR